MIPVEAKGLLKDVLVPEDLRKLKAKDLEDKDSVENELKVEKDALAK